MREWRVFVSVPFDLLVERYLPLVKERGLAVEVSLDRGVFDRFCFEDFRRVAGELREAGVRCNVHAPFCDLSPGALDSLVREASIRRLREALRVAALFDPETVVLHSGYHPGYHREQVARWQESLHGAIERLLAEARELGLTLALENVFEPSVEVLKPFFEVHPGLTWCFDPGHAQAFSRSRWEDWLPVLYPYLSEIHLHDNRGEWDEHLALGEGTIPFFEILSFVAEKGLRPVLTVEAHAEEAVAPSLSRLRELLGRLPPAA
ncbi:sugar phosphate isomerase/epimerase [Thermosulfurimonas sp. F29]|uniref:sugar phosphate isomerase/epimerase family protein n=1 Tax=Thermosulfurimonas sp. F29 TaxID=2867247 RepID=UPI001C830F0A|nr:sugar phosphate isomerase/epimerase family protein [Thermosulfurimonas sp. F29]MBX6423642.1 sugar phosphate isomerase/epimerase [Thermosulfurimonas sp. F29]